METQFMFPEHVIFMYAFGIVIAGILIAFFLTSKPFIKAVSKFRKAMDN